MSSPVRLFLSLRTTVNDASATARRGVRARHIAVVATLLLLMRGGVSAQGVNRGESTAREGTVAGVSLRTERTASAVPSCVVVHDVWKPQIAALQRTAAASLERAAAFERDVRQPYANFWRSYIGSDDLFQRWVRDRLRPEGDTRLALPHALNLAPLIAETTQGMATFTGRHGCGEWYAVFGPGRTDMGSLGNGRMVIDFLGMPEHTDVASLRFTLAHEVNHLIFGTRRQLDPLAGTVLYRMIDEGFAAYVAHAYDGTRHSPARALSWTEAELTWARRHERELWSMLQRYFESRHGDVHDVFFMYDQQVRPGAPGKIGYFLGYRIIEEYVRRNGRDSWRQLYDMDAAQIFQASGLSRPAN